MPRSSGGLVSADAELEVTTLARLMKIVRHGDNLTARFTDHDEDIEFPEETVRASQHFELCLTTIPDLSGTGSTHGPKPAVGYLSATGVPLHTNTVTIGTRVYTFITGAFSASGQVLIAADVPLTFANLRQAIIGGSGAGTVYSTGTDANTDVTATLTDITMPNPLEATLLATGKIASYFSNFTTNSGNWHDGNRMRATPDQAKTTDQTQGMWAGVTLNTPTSIVYAKVYTTQLWKTHTVTGANAVLYSYDHAAGWWFGPDGHIHANQGMTMMEADGYTWATG